MLSGLTSNRCLSPSARASTFRNASPDQPELDKLTPAQRTYVLDNFGDLLEAGTQIGVSKPEGNGNEPVLTLRTPDLKQRLDADPKLTFKVQTHYHGDIYAGNFTYSDKNTIHDAMKGIWDKDPLTMFVLPQTTVFGAAKTEPVATQLGYTAWNNVKDECETVDEALHEAGLDPARVADRTVSGHSSGGYPLSRVMASTSENPDHPTLDANRILVLDTVKGSLSDGTVPKWYHTHHPNTITYVAATMNEWTPAQAESYGWNYLKTDNHFDAVKSYLGYRGPEAEPSPPPSLA